MGGVRDIVVDSTVYNQPSANFESSPVWDTLLRWTIYYMTSIIGIFERKESQTGDDSIFANRRYQSRHIVNILYTSLCKLLQFVDDNKQFPLTVSYWNLVQ